MLYNIPTGVALAILLEILLLKSTLAKSLISFASSSLLINCVNAPLPVATPVATKFVTTSKIPSGTDRIPFARFCVESVTVPKTVFVKSPNWYPSSNSPA